MKAALLAALHIGAVHLGAAETALPNDPNAELATFQVAEGFEASLFASEKDGLIKPIQMRFDARGRLWVIGSAVYPQLEPGQKPNDKVLILEDTNRDGRVDSVKTFADGLMIPTGLELTRDGAYVGHGPELLLLRDTNGDDRADERTVVFRGFGTGDNHQNINSFTWGPTGELWMCQGLHTYSHVETPHGLVQLEKAGLWRFRPRTLKLEGFYGSEFEPQNPWGHVFNEWGEHLVLAGNNSSPIFPDPGLVPNRRDEPPPLIWPGGNGRKVSGGDFVANAHFPDDWQGRLILGGYINNAVWSANIVDDGAGFRFEDGPPLIRSTSREFRPVDVKFGPDGALYLCDWYNPIIGHYQASFRHPDRDKTHGRIWRVTAKNRPLTHVPELVNAGANELAALLQSGDRWTRQFARRELSHRPLAEVLPALDRWREIQNERALMDILGLYAAHEHPSPELLAKLCAATTPQVRAFAATVAGLWSQRLPIALEILRPLVADANPRVRLEALIACAQVNNPAAIDIAAIAADNPFDKFLNYAFNQTVHSLKPKWLPRLQSGELNFANHPDRLAALVRADASPDTLSALRNVLKNPKPDLLRILADNGTADDLNAILKLSPKDLDYPILHTIGQRNIKPSGNLEALLEPLLGSKFELDALKLAGKWKIASLFPKMKEMATNEVYAVLVRQSAIEALGYVGGDSDLLVQLATMGRIEVRTAAVCALQVFDPDKAAKAAVGILTHINAGFELAQGHQSPPVIDIITAFIQRPASAAALAKALNGSMIPDRVRELALTTLNASGRRYPELARIFATNPAQEKKIDALFIKEVREHGDTKRGQQVFLKPELGCVACHKINDEGGYAGPNLSALGTAQPIDFIIGAILDPQKEIKEGFTSISITTKAGDDFQGYLVRESREEIVLRDTLVNEEVKIRRSEIASQRANGSLMPNGLADQLTREEFRDLVKYLSTLGQP